MAAKWTMPKKVWARASWRQRRSVQPGLAGGSVCTDGAATLLDVSGYPSERSRDLAGAPERHCYEPGDACVVGQEGDTLLGEPRSRVIGGSFSAVPAPAEEDGETCRASAKQPHVLSSIYRNRVDVQLQRIGRIGRIAKNDRGCVRSRW